MSRTNENKLKMKDIATIGIFCCPLTGVTMAAGITRLVFRAPAGFSVGVSLGMVQDTIGISLCCSGFAVCLFSMQPMSA